MAQLSPCHNGKFYAFFLARTVGPHESGRFTTARKPLKLRQNFIDRETIYYFLCIDKKPPSSFRTLCWFYCWGWETGTPPGGLRSKEIFETMIIFINSGWFLCHVEHEQQTPGGSSVRFCYLRSRCHAIEEDLFCWGLDEVWSNGKIIET